MRDRDAYGWIWAQSEQCGSGKTDRSPPVAQCRSGDAAIAIGGHAMPRGQRHVARPLILGVQFAPSVVEGGQRPGWRGRLIDRRKEGVGLALDRQCSQRRQHHAQKRCDTPHARPCHNLVPLLFPPDASHFHLHTAYIQKYKSHLSGNAMVMSNGRETRPSKKETEAGSPAVSRARLAPVCRLV